MVGKNKKNKRSWSGYGSTYTRSSNRDETQQQGIDTVLGGQVWRIQPERQPDVENPCIWMQAGSVKFKTCQNFYDCTNCKYDHAMQRKVSQGKQIGWQEMMRQRSDKDRICRHSITKRAAHRTCPYDYRCYKCDFDQYLEDILTPKTGRVPEEIQEVRGFQVPMGYFFHNGHTWACLESGGYVRIGMDDFALKLFGVAEEFELPLIGTEFSTSRPGWGFQRQGQKAKVNSPVDGVVLEVNSKVRDYPELANKEPYSDGWIFLVHPYSKDMKKNLYTDTTWLDWIAQEVNLLEFMIEDVSGPMSVDGGTLQPDIFGNLPELGWKNLTKTFLKTD